MEDEFARLCQQELGIERGIVSSKFLGSYQHFDQDCVFNNHISTHYVVLAYEIVVNESELNLPIEQHNALHWFVISELLTMDDVHNHSKWYFQ